MKFVRFLHLGTPTYGIVHDDTVTIGEGDIFATPTLGGEHRPLKDLRLLPPCSPSKVIGIGLNYREHAKEVGKPLPTVPRFFLKPLSSIIGPGDEIIWPAMSRQIDYEAELAVVMGKRTKDVEPEDALAYVFGYTCANDVTARDLQRVDGMPNRAKAFDTFGPLGPCIATDLTPDALRVECYLNGRLRQSGSTVDLVFGVPQLVSFLSKIMTLLPGDVILTGTPPGIGPMQAGDEVEVRIEGIGNLRNSVGPYPNPTM